MLQKSIEKTSKIIDRVIDCAGRLFRRYGYKKTTVDDIASELHISKKTLYEVFPSKKTILQESMWHETKEVIKIFNKTLPADAHADIVLFSLCHFIFTDRIERDEDGYFWSIYSKDSMIEKAGIDALNRVIHAIYKNGCTHDLFKSINPTLAATLIVNMITTALSNISATENPYNMFNETIAMIADSVSYKYRLHFDGFKIDYYKTLGVSRDASDDEIRKAFRQKALQYHPDMTNGEKELDTKFIDSQTSYEILLNSEIKAEYDHFLSTLFSGDSESFSWDNTEKP